MNTFESFLEYLDKGATEEEAFFLVGHDIGFLCKEEVDFKLGDYVLPGIRLPMTRTWEIPTDSFDRIVYLKVWNTWLMDRIWRWVHNVQVEMQRKGLIKETVTDVLCHLQPQNIKEIQLETRLRDLASLKGDLELPFVIKKYRSKRLVTFAIQCLLQCPEKEAKRMLQTKIKPSFIMSKGSKEKSKKLKAIFADYGITVSFSTAN